MKHTTVLVAASGVGATLLLLGLAGAFPFDMLMQVAGPVLLTPMLLLAVPWNLPKATSTRRTHGVLNYLYMARLLTSLVTFVMTSYGLPRPVGLAHPMSSELWFAVAWLALAAIVALWLGRSLLRACQRQHLKTERKVRGHCEKFLAYLALFLVMCALSAVLYFAGAAGSGHIPLGTALIGLVTITAVGVALDADRDLQVGLVEAHDEHLATARSERTERAVEELIRHQRASHNGANTSSILRLFR